MTLRSAVAVHLDQPAPSSTHGLPFTWIVRSWMQSDFAPEACRASLLRFCEERPAIASLVNPDGILTGGLVASPELLFHEAGDWRLRFSSAKDLVLECELGGVSALGDVFRTGAMRELLTRIDADDIDDLVEDADAPGRVTWPKLAEPGLYRREHASLVVRSRTTTIVIDPIMLSELVLGAPRHVGVEQVDGVVITHSHGDHWQPPSILHVAQRAETRVIVPHVPRANLLTTEVLERQLGELGQAAEAPAWWTTVTIGDIEIDVLPFYGEQPTCEAPGAVPGVRNWGNCYRFNTPDFSAMVLVDSGRDPAGDMAEVARRSFEARGPVDMVLACMREFACPFFGGLSHYWGALEFARLQQLFEQHKRGELPSVTAGIAHLAKICDAAGARHFLPYAHGFAGVGVEIDDIGWGCGEPSERASLEALARHQPSCNLFAWNIGDSVALRDGQPVIRRSEALRLPETT